MLFIICFRFVSFSALRTANIFGYFSWQVENVNVIVHSCLHSNCININISFFYKLTFRKPLLENPLLEKVEQNPF